MSQNVYAFTSLDQLYPEYVSINKTADGKYEVTVRSKANADGTMGAQAVALLEKKELAKLGDAALSEVLGAYRA